MQLSKAQKFWKHHIEKFQSSGLTQVQYCKKNGLNKSSFSAQKCELKRSGLLQKKSSRELTNFIGVKGPKSFSITLNSGVSLQFDSIPDALWLRKFLGNTHDHRSREV